jgi:hypothetical protein
MGSENARDCAKPSIEVFERQTEYEAEGKTYTARCAVCGKAKTEKSRGSAPMARQGINCG